MKVFYRASSEKHPQRGTKACTWPYKYTVVRDGQKDSYRLTFSLLHDTHIVRLNTDEQTSQSETDTDFRVVFFSGFTVKKLQQTGATWHANADMEHAKQEWHQRCLQLPRVKLLFSFFDNTSKHYIWILWFIDTIFFWFYFLQEPIKVINTHTHTHNYFVFEYVFHWRQLLDYMLCMSAQPDPVHVVLHPQDIENPQTCCSALIGP